ncbi:hypothetical protein HMPREF9998_01280 [Peptostreptococcus anaerobius VPI 4330 = DSM 2949]|nr:hypothetical protein HMPREF9998_01280 [Peptostreptococcus anaerobius VPI 4330 = DSM 2949]
MLFKCGKRGKKMNYIERMEQEYIELTGRGEKLYKAIKTLEGLTPDELGLMYAQYYSIKIMKKYCQEEFH